MSEEKKLYGLFMYDVPIHMRKLYQKIRKETGPYCIMQTWSCYLFPWGMRDKIETIMDDLNEEAKAQDRIMWRLLLQDSSQEDVHEQMVFEGLTLMLRNIRNLLDKRIRDAAEKINEATMEGVEPKTTMDKARQIACRKARKAIKDAQKQALVFDASNDMEEAFETYTKIIDAEAALGSTMPGADEQEEEEPVAETTAAEG